MSKDFCSKVQCSKKHVVTEALIMVLLLNTLQNKVHVSRNCSDVSFLQNTLCLFLYLSLISGIKEYPKSFSLLQVSPLSNSLGINNILLSPVVATTNACQSLSLCRRSSSTSLQMLTEHWSKGKCICSSEVLLLYLSNDFLYSSLDLFLIPESIFYEGERSTE